MYIKRSVTQVIIKNWYLTLKVAATQIGHKQLKNSQKLGVYSYSSWYQFYGDSNHF